MTLRLPRGRLTRGAISALVAGLLVAVVLLSLGPPVDASPTAPSTQLSGATIKPVFLDGEPSPPKITAAAAILVDMDSGELLYSRNAEKRLPMASTTKIMTAMLALESLKLDAKVRVSARAEAEPGSKLWLEAGEVLTVEQLMYALLVASANDAAVALAEAAAGSVSDFVKRMNEKAKELGLTNTHFANPNGLNDEKHFSSAKDLATLARYAMQNSVFRRIVGTRAYTIPWPGNDTPRKLKNGNVLLGQLGWVTGIKTGSTPYAHYCLVASGNKESVPLVAVVLGAANDKTRWREATALFEYGMALYPLTNLVDRGQAIAEVDPPDVLDRTVRLVADRSLTVRLFKSDVVTGRVQLDREVALPVLVGNTFGKIEFTVDGESLGSANLVAAQSIEKPTIRMIMDYWRDSWPPGIAFGERLEALGHR